MDISTQQPKILLVEDDLDLADALVETIISLGYLVEHAEDGVQALDKLGLKTFDLILSDASMPNMDGYQLLAKVKENHAGTPFIIMTAYASVEKAVSSLKIGAVDYLVKPFEGEVLSELLTRIVPINKAPSELDCSEVVAEDPLSTAVFDFANRIAANDSSVLIMGESGTGKEVLAHFIHKQSPRSEAPFIAINCAAIPDNMLEATLFGYEKGAFTGAHQSSVGKFEQAQGGTILLDEISEMALGLQAKILRVLQEKEVERIGSKKTINLDVRVIATCNRDLKLEVAESRFREDLYYRLNVFPVHWHPLRDRKKDIVPLAKFFLEKHLKQQNKTGTFVELSDSAIEILMEHHWPGNIRELDNVIQRAMVFYQGSTIEAGDLMIDTIPVSKDKGLTSSGDGNHSLPVVESDGVLGEGMRQREFELLLDTLKSVSGSRKKASEKLGISPRTLRYKLAKLRDEGVDIEEALRA